MSYHVLKYQAPSSVHTLYVFTRILGGVQYQHHCTDETGKTADKGTQTNAAVELSLNPALSDPKACTWQQALLPCKYSSSFPVIIIIKIEFTWSWKKLNNRVPSKTSERGSTSQHGIATEFLCLCQLPPLQKKSLRKVPCLICFCLSSIYRVLLNTASSY